MESVAWQSAHYEEPFATERRRKFPAKLARLGLDREARSARILDTCCGRADGLETLREWGFTDLSGLDMTPHPDWKTLPYPIQQGSVMAMPFPDASFDCVTNFHALHHLEGPQGVAQFLRECHRVLKPGGRLYIIDFPASPQIMLLFRLFRLGLYPPTPGLANFKKIVDEEWSYLLPYLKSWSGVSTALRGGPLKLASWDQSFFLYFLRFVKE